MGSSAMQVGSSESREELFPYTQSRAFLWHGHMSVRELGVCVCKEGGQVEARDTPCPLLETQLQLDFSDTVSHIYLNIAIPFPGIYYASPCTCGQKCTYRSVHVITAYNSRNGKQPKCPSVGDRLSRLQQPHTVGFCAPRNGWLCSTDMG